MRGLLIVFLCLLVAAVSTVAIASEIACCPVNDPCVTTIEVPATVIVAETNSHSMLATVGRSVGIVRGAALAPVRVVSKTVTVIKNREHKPVVRIFCRAGGRLTCPCRHE